MVPEKNCRHDAVGALPHGDVALVAFSKFFLLLALAGEGTGDADAGDAVFQAGVDLSDLDAVLAEGHGHGGPLFDDEQHQERQHRKGDECQRDVDGAQNDEGADHGDDRDEQILRAVVGKLGDVHQVVDDARHDDAGLVLVKVGERQLLQVLKDVAAHVCLHAHADDVALVLHEVLHDSLDDVDHQQRRAPGQDQPDVFVRDVGVDDVAGNHRIHQVAAGGNQRADHVEHKQLPVRLVVMGKRSQHKKTLPHDCLTSNKFFYDTPFCIFLQSGREAKRKFCCAFVTQDNQKSRQRCRLSGENMKKKCYPVKEKFYR